MSKPRYDLGVCCGARTSDSAIATHVQIQPMRHFKGV